MEEVITSRFSAELLKKVDQAVSRGYFKSRSYPRKVTNHFPAATNYANN